MKYLILAAAVLMAGPAVAEQQRLFLSDAHGALIREGIDLLYNLRYHEALARFDRLLPEFKEHPAPWFFRAMVYWIQSSGYEDPERSDRLMTENIRIAIDKARSGLARDPGNPAYTFYLAGGLGFLGRLQMVREQWGDALSTGWEAYRLLEEASKRSLENKDILLGLGVFNVYAGRLPETLRKMAALLGVRGDWQLGLRQLHEAAEHAPFAGVEARISLAYLYAYTIRDAVKAVQMLEPLVAQFPENPSFLITLADAETALGRYERAISNAQLCLGRIEEGRYPAAWRFRTLAQLGKIEFSRDDYRKALFWLDQAARLKPMPKNPGNYLAWVHYRKGKIFLRYGYRALAEKDFQDAVRFGGSDRVAELARQELEVLKRPR